MHLEKVTGKFFLKTVNSLEVQHHQEAQTCFHHSSSQALQFHTFDIILGHAQILLDNKPYCLTR